MTPQFRVSLSFSTAPWLFQSTGTADKIFLNLVNPWAFKCNDSKKEPIYKLRNCVCLRSKIVSTGRRMNSWWRSWKNRGKNLFFKLTGKLGWDDNDDSYSTPRVHFVFVQDWLHQRVGLWHPVGEPSWLKLSQGWHCSSRRSHCSRDHLSNVF